MPIYDQILSTETDPDQPLKSSLAKRWSDNFLAALEGDPSAVTAGVTVKDASLDAGAATAAGIAWVGLRTAGLATGAVGSYALLSFNALTAASAGSTHAGSALRYSHTAGVTSGGAPSGTWRLMGFTQIGSQANSTSLFLRIS